MVRLYKQKYVQNANICYMDTESFIFHVKTNDIYKDIEEDVVQDLTLQILKKTDHYQKEKIKK